MEEKNRKEMEKETVKERVLLLQSNEKKKFQVSGQITVTETADNSIRGKKKEREKRAIIFLFTPWWPSQLFSLDW